MVATKAALSIRVDALTDAEGKSADDAPTIGLENRAKLESRLRALEHHADAGAGGRRAPTRTPRAPTAGAARAYNDAADAPLVPAQREPLAAALAAVEDVKAEKRAAKEARRAARRAGKDQASSSVDIPAGRVPEEVDVSMDVDGDDSSSEKSEKKRKRRESALDVDVEMKVSYAHMRSNISDELVRLKRRTRSARQERKPRRTRRRPLLPRTALGTGHQQRTARRRRKRRGRKRLSDALMICSWSCICILFCCLHLTFALRVGSMMRGNFTSRRSPD
jgi:hypothetical protein